MVSEALRWRAWEGRRVFVVTATVYRHSVLTLSVGARLFQAGHMVIGVGGGGRDRGERGSASRRPAVALCLAAAEDSRQRMAAAYGNDGSYSNCPRVVTESHQKRVQRAWSSGRE